MPVSLLGSRYVLTRIKHNRVLSKHLISLRFVGVTPPRVGGILALRMRFSTS